MSVVGILGGLTVDHIVQAHGPAHFDLIGGPGLYASLGASLVDGVTVRLSCDLPENPIKFRHILDRAGVDIGHCTDGRPVPRLWILYSEGGRRIVPTAAAGSIEIAGANEFDDDEFDDDEPEADADGFVPGAAFFDGLDALLACAPRRPVRGVASHTAYGIDPEQREVRQRGWSYWEEIAHGADVLLPSRMQLLLLDDDAIRAAEQLAERLAVPVIARLDQDGVMVVDAFAGRWFVRDTRVRVVDPTGAGDTMAGATMAALSAGHGLVEAAAVGVAAARRVLADWGPAGLVNHPQPIIWPCPGVEVTKDEREHHYGVAAR